MSGLRDEHLVQAYRVLHAHGITTEALAAELATARTYVSRVLGGHERRGRTWERIRRILTERAPRALELLEAVPGREPAAVARPVRPRRTAEVVSVPYAGPAINHTAAPVVRRYKQWTERMHA